MAKAFIKNPFHVAFQDSLSLGDVVWKEVIQTAILQNYQQAISAFDDLIKIMPKVYLESPDSVRLGDEKCISGIKFTGYEESFCDSRNQKISNLEILKMLKTFTQASFEQNSLQQAGAKEELVRSAAKCISEVWNSNIRDKTSHKNTAKALGTPFRKVIESVIAARAHLSTL